MSRMTNKRIFTSRTAGRPATLSLVAWSWLLTGVLLMLGSVLILFAGGMVNPEQVAAQLPPEFAGMLVDMKTSRAAMLVQLAVGIVALTAGAQLLALRAWARTAVELLSWASLAYVGYAAWRWSAMFATMSGDIANGAMVDAAGMRGVGFAVAVLVAVVLAIPLVLMIKYLRTRAVRELVRGR